MHFPTLDKARKWIFGDAYKQKAAAGSLLELKARAGTAIFELSSVQVNEAINAFKRLGKVNMSLTEAVDFAIKKFKTGCWDSLCRGSDRESTGNQKIKTAQLHQRSQKALE
jgi:hypothetical protein